MSEGRGSWLKLLCKRWIIIFRHHLRVDYEEESKVTGWARPKQMRFNHYIIETLPGHRCACSVWMCVCSSVCVDAGSCQIWFWAEARYLNWRLFPAGFSDQRHRAGPWTKTLFSSWLIKLPFSQEHCSENIILNSWIQCNKKTLFAVKVDVIKAFY